jgi:hypothetical protein
MSLKGWLVVFGALLTQLAFGQTDEAIFAETMQLPKGRTVAETALVIGQHFLGAPYVTGTLESPDGVERLTVNLREFDCATFVESVLALAWTRHSPHPDFEMFRQHLQSLRYRRGQVVDYASRFHYFSDWLEEQAAAGRLVNLTEKMGGKPMNKLICFMTSHRNRYASLDNSLVYKEINALEQEINHRPLFFIPKNRVPSLENQLRDGDLIGITTAKFGLDVAHEGFVLRRHGRAYLLHASSHSGRVVLTPTPLSEYLTRNATRRGIMVARWIP